MKNETIARPYALDWVRVGALSGSFAAHAVILLLAVLPMTVPVTRPAVEEIVARWIESPPPPQELPEPAPPKPAPHRVRALPVHVATPPAPVPDVPAPPPESHATAPVLDPGPTTSPPDIGSGGATQALAYASPMQPRYPPASVHAREEGTVTLRVLVDASGVPQRVEIARSSGHARLDAAAKESVGRARFRPVMRNGVAVQAWGIVPIAFRLERG